ncbi:MAG: hypothetical protein UH853_04110 [Muribaculaceae bacterium]|nr:hypothetical protein [Muribaculaceae bacterium]
MLTCKICRQTKNEYYTIHNHTTYYCLDCYKFEKESTERKIRQLHEKRRFFPRPDFNDDNAVKRATKERQSIDYDIKHQTEFLTMLNKAVHIDKRWNNELWQKKDKEDSLRRLLDAQISRISYIIQAEDVRKQKELEEQRRKQEEQRRKQEEQRRKMQEESRKRAEEKHREQMGCIKGIILFFIIASILWIAFAYLFD